MKGEEVWAVPRGRRRVSKVQHVAGLRHIEGAFRAMMVEGKT
jgi:hypothetical protein